MKLGVYVGSFNPIHKGHINIINFLLDKSYLDKVMIIPTDNYWDKNDLLNIHDRIKMAKFYEGNQIIINSELSYLEYTYQILNELSKKYDDLYLIIGADNVEKFHLWKNIDEILKYHIIIMPRDNIKVNLTKFNCHDKFIIIKGFKETDISSTMIRKKIIKNDINNITDFLDDHVWNYINSNNLYKNIL